MNVKSYMMAIPGEDFDIMDFDGMVDRLKNNDKFKLKDMKMDKESENFSILVEFEDEEYSAAFYPMTQSMPEMCRQSHGLTEKEKQRVDNFESGIGVELEFGENSLKSYHLQIKILCTMVPDIVGVVDYSACQLLSGQWASLAANSKTPPAPMYLYGIHAVSEDNGCVWLHSHGLNRCGLPEIEVLKSDTQGYRHHGDIMRALASRMLEMEEAPEEEEAIYLGELSNGTSLVVTLIPWQEAVEYLKEPFLGDSSERFEGHIENTMAIFTYESEADYNQGIYKPVSIYDELLSANPLYFISNSETARMKALARERVNFMQEALEVEDNVVIAKIGLTVDEEYRTETNSLEHIWFDVKSFDGNSLKGILTQAPYYVSGIKEGDEGTYTLEDITDWIIYTPEHQITPDNVYLLSM